MSNPESVSACRIQYAIRGTKNIDIVMKGWIY